MSHPTSDKFHRLIRRNKGSTGPSTSSIISNGKEIHSPDMQRQVFAQYYEDLSIPKDEDYDSAFLKLCNVSCVKKANQTLNQLLRVKY